METLEKTIVLLRKFEADKLEELDLEFADYNELQKLLEFAAQELEDIYVKEEIKKFACPQIWDNAPEEWLEDEDGEEYENEDARILKNDFLSIMENQYRKIKDLIFSCEEDAKTPELGHELSLEMARWDFYIQKYPYITNYRPARIAFY